jgi:hypothetical protein
VSKHAEPVEPDANYGTIVSKAKPTDSTDEKDADYGTIVTVERD